MATFLRTPETMRKYAEERVLVAGQRQGHCVLCEEEPIEKFIYWKIIPNNFPYDQIATQNDMLVPLRHAVGDELSREEKDEFENLKRVYVREKYDSMMENTPRTMTKPSHFHIHLLKLKRS